MRHLRMLGLCLVAAFAVAAVAATSSSALEWGQCYKIESHEGKYTDSNCTKKAKKVEEKFTGEFEWRTAKQVSEKRVAEGKSAGVPFTGHNVGAGGILTSGLRTCHVEGAEPAYKQLTRKACAEKSGEEKQEVSEPLQVECAAESDHGEAAPANKVVNVHVTFTGCLALGVIPCNTSGKAAEEIITNPLKGNLGYIKKPAPKEVGLLLNPAKSKAPFAAFECGPTGEPLLHVVVGVGSETQGAEFTTSGCSGVSCTGATPEEEKFGGYDGIISPITPFNQMTSEYTQVYTREAEAPWRNVPSKFEGKHIDVLEDYFVNGGGELSDWSAAGQVVTVTNTSEEVGEIKA